MEPLAGFLHQPEQAGVDDGGGAAAVGHQRGSGGAGIATHRHTLCGHPGARRVKPGDLK